MKTLPYILIAILAFGLGWFIRPDPSSSSKKSDTVTITNTVRKVDVDTLYLLAPQFYLAWVDKTDTIHLSDTCWHLREYKEYRDSNYYAKVSGVAPRLDEIRVYPRTITRLNTFVVTSYKKTNAGGLVYLLAMVSVETVYPLSWR